MKRVILSAVLFSIILSFSASPLIAQAMAHYEERPIEYMNREIMGAINRERKKLGLSVLLPDEKLSEVALRHSRKMMDEKTLSHVFPSYRPLELRLMDHQVCFLSFGENVAKSETYLVEPIHQSLMESPGHRENILKADFTHCGIGFIKDEENIYYVTQIFAKLYTLYTAQEAEDILMAYIKSRYAGPEGGLPIHYASRNELARKFSRERFKGKSLAYLKKEYEAVDKFRYINSYVTGDLEKAKEQIAAIDPVYLKRYCVGVAYGRTEAFPGGAYAVTLLLYGNEYLDMGEEALLQLVFNAINEVREMNDLPPFGLHKKLSKSASEIARAHYFAEPVTFPKGRHSYLTMEMVNPNEIPNQAKAMIINIREYAEEIGIGIFLPESEGLESDNLRFILIFKLK
jgi:uncharacterized protein YkwD